MYVLIGIPQLANALIQRGAIGDRASQGYFVSSQVISFGCQVVVTVFLLTKADWLASLVFPVDREISLGLTASELQSVLFAAIGLYFLLDGFRHLVASGYLLATRPRNDYQNSAAYLYQRSPENLARAVGGTIAGALVLIGRRRLTNFWKRYVGRSEEMVASDRPDQN